MHAQLQAMHQSKAEVIGLVDAPNLEYALGTHRDASPLAFTTFQIDDRRYHARFLFAVAR